MKTVRDALPATEDAHYWVAVEAASTRDITRHLRRTLGVGRHQVTSLGYWSVR